METAISRSEIQVEPLARDTLQDRVYNQLAGLILDGGIVPGQLVTIQGLAEAFDVSTMPVREALKRLTAANALTVVSGRSIGIPPLSLDRLTDLRNVRREMEGTAVAWAARSIGAAALVELEEHLERMLDFAAKGDVKSYLQGNRAFHFTIYRASESATLVGLIEILWLQISPYFNLMRSRNHMLANLHHRAMLEALREGDAAKASAALVGDIDTAYDVLAAAILGD
jgi:DNA-binding GntR family transcriptional regulator